MIKDDKLKGLMPSLRVKKRFLRVHINSLTLFEFKEISEYLNSELLKYLGGITYSKAGVWILRDKFNKKEQELILKVSHNYVDELIGTLGIISQFGKEKINLDVVKVSGTLKGVQKTD